jgi:transcriptional regulator with XRE-family HTH domain
MTGNELKQERKRLKISQQTLAVRLDLALSTVARWEQLKDENIPNSTILELALRGLKAQVNTKRRHNYENNRYCQSKRRCW